MESEIGRYLEGRLLPAINLIKLIHDLGTGAGYDVSAWIDGRSSCSRAMCRGAAAVF